MFNCQATAAIRAQIADSVNLLIHSERRIDGGRFVSEVMEVSRYDAASEPVPNHASLSGKGNGPTATA